MLSMTGYGKSNTVLGTTAYTVEIRSVNNRFLDCSARLPGRFAYLEESVRNILQKYGITRGKISISVRTASSESGIPKLDIAAAQAYLNELYVLRDRFGLPDDISVMRVAENDRLFMQPEELSDPEKDLSDLQEVLKPALEQYLKSASAEGSRLKTDILNKLDRIEASVASIQAVSGKVISDYRDRFEARLRTLLADNSLSFDDSRILTECAIFADKVAIDEELVRLGSHISAFRETVDREDSVGKILDFTLQEMNREINTIGSKCINADIAKTVISVKNELEKIREQIQNIA
ncbi:MAG: YicC family protein [Clostridia bacterium]|nr:YicC family protein [Clostridia bacterium]